jgi:predicted TIM-barrel fold metal-dependent hydrolase
MSSRPAAEIRAQLQHPVIDIDGHTVEFVPALESYLRAEGVALHDALSLTMPGSLGPVMDWYSLSIAERAEHRVARGPWGIGLEHTIDQATAFLPRLLYSRLDELGIDFSVIYPSIGLLFPHLSNHDHRRGACRALNRFNSEVFAPFSDRMIPVAEIPMHTPEEAIDELEHAVGSLGFKAIVMPNFVQRPVSAVAERHPDVAPWALWTDTFGYDSQYDYDPVWAKCRELDVSPSFHSAAMGWPNRRSISSYVYNHVGMLGESHHSTAKSLVMGGVTRRFADLNFAFLEGGVAWAASLLCDLIGHWEKRNGRRMEYLEPAERINRDEFVQYFQRYGGDWASMVPPARSLRPEDTELIDEFAACGIERVDDFYELFVPRIYCGCEADDPMTATAFNDKVNPFGAKLNAFFGSDISHWDVPVMADVLGESREMVEHGHLTEDDYRDFMFVNPVRFYTHANPRFFEGTSVEADSRALTAHT